MSSRIIKNASEKILIVGPTYGNLEKLSKAQSLLSNYQYVIFNGYLYYKFMDLGKLQIAIDTMNELLQTGKVIYNMGPDELMLLEGILIPEVPNKICNWFLQHPNVTIVEFSNQHRIIITSGGVTPKMKYDKLKDNLETSFVNNINQEPWHKLYGGGYGYIVSNNPLTEEPPKFYNYSAQIGNYMESNTVYAQEANQFGLKETIVL